MASTRTNTTVFDKVMRRSSAPSAQLRKAGRRGWQPRALLRSLHNPVPVALAA